MKKLLIFLFFIIIFNSFAHDLHFYKEEAKRIQSAKSAINIFSKIYFNPPHHPNNHQPSYEKNKHFIDNRKSRFKSNCILSSNDLYYLNYFIYDIKNIEELENIEKIFNNPKITKYYNFLLKISNLRVTSKLMKISEISEETLKQNFILNQDLYELTKFGNFKGFYDLRDIVFSYCKANINNLELKNEQNIYLFTKNGEEKLILENNIFLKKVRNTAQEEINFRLVRYYVEKLSKFDSYNKAEEYINWILNIDFVSLEDEKIIQKVVASCPVELKKFIGRDEYRKMTREWVSVNFYHNLTDEERKFKTVVEIEKLKLLRIKEEIISTELKNLESRISSSKNQINMFERDYARRNDSSMIARGGIGGISRSGGEINSINREVGNLVNLREAYDNWEKELRITERSILVLSARYPSF